MLDKVQQRKHLVMLVTLIIMSLAQPVARGFVGGLIVYDILLTIVVLGVFAIVAKRNRDRWVTFAIGMPAIVTRWIVYGLSGDLRWACMAAHHALLLALFAFSVAVILRDIFEERVIKADHVIGTVCGYLLAGAAWGNVYELAQQFDAGSFSVKPEIAWQLDDIHLRSFLFSHFSLCTLAGVADDDIRASGPSVTTLTWIEAMFGQFYLAVVVAQLVGFKLAQAIGNIRQTK